SARAGSARLMNGVSVARWASWCATAVLISWASKRFRPPGVTRQSIHRVYALCKSPNDSVEVLPGPASVPDGTDQIAIAIVPRAAAVAVGRCPSIARDEVGEIRIRPADDDPLRRVGEVGELSRGEIAPDDRDEPVRLRRGRHDRVQVAGDE